LPTSTIFAISLFFHLLATVVWIGGLIITALLVWPEVRRALENSPALYSTMNRLRRRFTPWGYLSLAVLIVTGLIQMALSPHYTGFMDFSSEWSRAILFKHIALGGMIVCGAILQYGVAPALERVSLMAERGKDNPEEWVRLRKREVRLTWINIILGIAVLGFSVWAGTLSRQ
jgi:uncharacterized membrane protein